MSTSDTLHTVGSNIFLAGLVLQLASFALFTVMVIIFIYRVWRYDRHGIWAQPGWKSLYAALGWTCVMFLIRSVFRTVELSEGYTGYLSTHEIYYICLDALPLWLGIIVYVYYWPPRFLDFGRRAEMERDEETLRDLSHPNGSTTLADKYPNASSNVSDNFLTNSPTYDDK